MTLADHLADIQTRLRSGAYPNESAISQGIVLRVLSALDWPVYDPHVVYPEYSVKGRRVDFALCHPADKPRVFVEVKQPGQARGADQQLFEYAFHAGVPMAVMTDGREWHVYVPAGAGSYDERRVYLLDLYERTPDAAAESLRRYLGYERVRTEAAMRAARDDYDRIARSREGERHLPDAWARLLAEPDAALVALLAEKVEGLCGVLPDEARVEAFLQTRQRDPASPARPTRPSPPVVRDPASTPAPTLGVTVAGVFHPAKSGVEVFTTAFRVLCERDPSFATRFAEQKHGSRRRYLARTREELFPGYENLQEFNVRELPNGWLLNVSVNTGDIKNRLKLACEVAGMSFGKDVILHL